MKRIGIIGLRLAAAFAFSATAGASAAQVAEYGQCVAVKKTGVYTDSNCTTVAEKKGKPTYKGGWEFESGPSPTCVEKKDGDYSEAKCETSDEKNGKGKGKWERACVPNCAAYTGSTGRADLHTPTLGAAGVECTASTGTGEITGPTIGVDNLTLTNCSTLGQKCTSEGETEGTIRTFPLEARLVANGEKGPSGDEPAEGEVWTELTGKPEFAGYTAIFSCTGVGFFATKGSLSGITNPTNVMSLTSSTAFQGLAGEGGPGIGEQDLTTEYGETGSFPSGIGPFASSGELENAKTFAATAEEIRVVGCKLIDTVLNGLGREIARKVIEVKNLKVALEDAEKNNPGGVAAATINLFKAEQRLEFALTVFAGLEAFRTKYC